MTAPVAPASSADSASTATAAAGSRIASSAPAHDRPDYKRPEYTDAESSRALCRDLNCGTRALHERADVYLPRWSEEDANDYKIRSSLTEVFRAFARTVQAAVGMILATPPRIGDGTAKELAADWEDIDGRGTHGEVFAKRVLEDAMVDGFSAILVDYPPVPADEAFTLADEQALGLRPFWVHVTREQIISWTVEVPDWSLIIALHRERMARPELLRAFARQAILRQVVLWEPTDVRAGAYGTKKADRYRVLTLGTGGVQFIVWEKRKTDHGEAFVMIDQGTMTGAGRKPLPAIPLALCYAGNEEAPFVCDPPLLALAELNIGHYRVSADRRYLMRLCHAPTLAIIGAEMPGAEDDESEAPPRQYKVGPNHVLMLPKGGDAKWVAAPGDALQSSKEEKDDLVKQMAALGMSFLAKDQRGKSETALGRKLDDAAENATHATAARGLQDALEQAFQFHAAFRGVEPAEVVVNTSYASPQVDPQIATVLWNAVAADRLDMESFIQYVQTGDLPDDIADRLDELKMLRLATQAAANDEGGNGLGSGQGSGRPSTGAAAKGAPAKGAPQAA
jgi:hypothetical protein